jgi:serine/alanine adding enzyme
MSLKGQIPPMSDYTILHAAALDRQQWDEYVSTHEHGTVFHSSFLFDAFSLTTDFKPFALFALDSRDNIQAMLQGFFQTVKPGLLAGLSTRAVLLKSPLHSDLSALKPLLAALKEHTGKQAVYTEIRSHWTDAISASAYAECGFELHSHLNYLVDCSDPNRAWQAISESKRRQIRKALSVGAEIIDAPDVCQLEEFYHILAKLYREKVRKPLPSYDFFRVLFDSSKEAPEQIRFLLVKFSGRIIGGICCPVSGHKAIHELYVAGLDAEYKELYPSSLATWAAIDYASKKGIFAFDFMGAGRPEEAYGVREFKSRFGGTLVDTGRYQCIHSPAKMLIAKSGFKILGKLKGWI